MTDVAETKDIEEYIGDGVYVSYDGYHYTLDLRAQPPTTPITKIVMEPVVMREFKRFIDRIEGMS